MYWLNERPTHSAPRSPPLPTRHGGRSWVGWRRAKPPWASWPRPHAMSLPSISRHLKVLEGAGLIVKGRSAQWRPCRLDVAPLVEAEAWMAPYRTFFEARLATPRAATVERTRAGGRMTSTADTRRDFILTWTLDASPAEVFRAWTEPDRLGWFYNDAQPVPAEPHRTRPEGRRRLAPADGHRRRARRTRPEGSTARSCPVRSSSSPGERPTAGPSCDPERLDESPLVTVRLRRDDARTKMTVHIELPAGLSEEGVAGMALPRHPRRVARHRRPARARVRANSTAA